jgi:hypothetical protein
LVWTLESVEPLVEKQKDRIAGADDILATIKATAKAFGCHVLVAVEPRDKISPPPVGSDYFPAVETPAPAHEPVIEPDLDRSAPWNHPIPEEEPVPVVVVEPNRDPNEFRSGQEHKGKRGRKDPGRSLTPAEIAALPVSDKVAAA